MTLEVFKDGLCKNLRVFIHHQTLKKKKGKKLKQRERA